MGGQGSEDSAPIEQSTNAAHGSRPVVFSPRYPSFSARRSARCSTRRY